MKERLITYIKKNDKLVYYLVLSLVLFYILLMFFPINYFKNSNLDVILLSRANRIFSNFVYAFLIMFFVLFIILFTFLNKIKSDQLHAISNSIPILILILGKDVFKGFYLLFNTKNLTNPAISSFTWASREEFSTVFLNGTFYSYLFSIPLIIVFIIIKNKFYQKQKA